MTKKDLLPVKTAIDDARLWLDAAMYSSPESVTEEQHACLREAYDLLCQASDKLYNLPL